MPTLPWSLDALALKATVVLVGALLVAYALRRASGSSRHTLWTATTLALLALPILESNLPRLPLAWLPTAPVTASEQTLSAEEVGVAAGVSATADAADRLVRVAGNTLDATDISPPPRIGLALGVVWLIGVVGFAIPVLVGVVRSRRVMARAIDVSDDRLQDHFAHARRLVAAPQEVALRLSPEIRTAMTGGILHPVVLLPESARMWSDECLAAVLRHELVHVRQRDALRQLGSRLSVALYWFHPLAWRAARLGALAREMACDESVLRLGTRPSRYARHLLALADPLPAPMAPALVRLDHPHLEERVMAILRASPPPASRRLSISAAFLIFSWTAVVAAASPTARAAMAEEPRVSAREFPAELVAVPSVVTLDELAQARAADCENLRDTRARSVSGNGSAVRMFTTDHEGTRICVTVRGGNGDRAGFLPRSPLPNGVVLTLATSNGDGERHLEIEGTRNGNVHRWTVDGRSMSFDNAAAQWRDAMLDLVGVLTEQSAADRARAIEAMGMSRRSMEAAASESRRAMVAGRRAAGRADMERETAARVAEGVNERVRVGAAEQSAHAAEVAMARQAHEIAMARGAMEHDAEAMAVAGVRGSGGGRAMIAPMAATGRGVMAPEMAERQLVERELLERHRRSLEAQRSETRERVAELRAHEVELRQHQAELERDHRRMAEEIRHAMPAISEGRNAGRLHEMPAPPAPSAPRAVGGMPVPPVAPRIAPMEERALDPRAQEANRRLREAIRVTGET